MEGVPQAAPKQNGLELLDCENTYPNLRRQIYGRCPASSTQTEWFGIAGLREHLSKFAKANLWKVSRKQHPNRMVWNCWTARTPIQICEGKFMEGVPQAAPKQNGLELLDCENTYPNLRRQIYGRCPASSTQTEWFGIAGL